MPHDRALARRLAQDALRRGDALGWFETLYSDVQGEAAAIPWADLVVNPNLKQWLNCAKPAAEGRTALVIGCGLGDDAEALSQSGFQVTAFDIAPTSIAWCRERFPQTAVNYCVADLLQAPASWRQHFDFVLEAYTLQVLPADLRETAVSHIAQFVAPGGKLLVISRGRDEADAPGKMPWPLLRSELDGFCQRGLIEAAFEDYVEQEDPPVRRFRAEYRRPTS